MSDCPRRKHHGTRKWSARDDEMLCGSYFAADKLIAIMWTEAKVAAKKMKQAGIFLSTTSDEGY